MGQIDNNVVTVASTATLLYEATSPEGARVFVQNIDATTDCFMGGAGVTSSGAKKGMTLTHGAAAPSGPFQLEYGDKLYAITAASTALVEVLAI